MLNFCLSFEEYLFLFNMIGNCFYGGDDDVKNNNGFDNHADNHDDQFWIDFIDLLRVSWVKQM